MCVQQLAPIAMTSYTPADLRGYVYHCFTGS